MSDSELRSEVYDAFECSESRRRISILRIATQATDDMEFLEEILDFGLRKKLVSEIGAWFKLLIPKIGSKKIIEKLFDYVGSDDEVVDIALYHLDGQVEGDDLQCLEKLRSSYLIHKSQIPKSEN